MLDVLDTAIDLIEGGAATSLRDPELMELARLARREDQLIRGELVAMAQTDSESMYEALFR